MNLDWQASANCATADPELFYPDPGGSAHDALRICGQCPVQEECLEHAMAADERFGVWGGFTAQDREALRNDRPLSNRGRQSMLPIEHGTRRGYSQHRYRGEKGCAPCKRAHTDGQRAVERAARERREAS